MIKLKNYCENLFALKYIENKSINYMEIKFNYK